MHQIKAGIFLRLILISGIVTSTLASCVHEGPEKPSQPGTGGNGNGGSTGGSGSTPCDPSIIYFEKQVLPILQSNCAMSGCHDANSAEDGIILNSFQSVMSSDIVDPGNANNSDIIEALLEEDDEDRMPRPPAERLSNEQINIIRSWINQGAQNIICNQNDCDTSNITYSGTVKPIMQTYCMGCHNPNMLSAGIDLSVHSGTQSSALNGRLYGAVTHAAGFKAMPQGANKLSDCDISKLRKWINGGALNN